MILEMKAMEKNIGYNKAFTLLETLLSTILMLIFSVSFILCFNSINNEKNIESNVSEYLTINRYVKCYAELNGKKTKISIIENKLKVEIEEDIDIYTNIILLQPQIDNLNNIVNFEIPTEDVDDGFIDNEVVIYLPDGSIEKSRVISLGEIDNTNNIVNILSVGFNRFEINYLNITNTDFYEESN